MAPPKMLLLQALFFSLLLLMVPSHCNVDPTSTTPAISRVSSTACSITAGFLEYRRIRCPKFPKSADLPAVVPSLPNILPGVCVQDETFCSSRVYLDSGYLCGGSGVICKNSNAGRTRESYQFCLAVIEWSQDLSKTIWETLRKWWFTYGITGTVYCLIFIVCSLCFWLCYHCFWLCYYYFCVKHFRFNEIMAITDHFRTPVGAHIFGSMFQGRWQFQFGKRLVAVKHFNTELSLESMRAFNAELQMLSKTRHPNVVRLFGYCTENNVHVLVTELMAQRDLYWHLHPRGRPQTRSELFSSWKIRMTVLLEAAQGIEYLHQYAKPRIIHRDIKTANILINDNWVAKISNFGMAVIGPEPGSDYVELKEPIGTEVGMAGYMDPECNDNNLRATPRNDVYSFGVVMLEVVTGRRSIDKHTGRKLAEFASEKVLSGQIMEVFDKKLLVPAGHELDAAIRVAQLATQCIRVPGVERPEMSAVVTELQGVLELFDLSEPSTS